MKNFNEFVNEQRNLNEESKLQKEYQEFFLSLLKKYDVESPAELDDDKKIEFFDDIKKHYTKGKGVKDSGKKIIDDEK